jgi:hypothetical protein
MRGIVGPTKPRRGTILLREISRLEMQENAMDLPTTALLTPVSPMQPSLWYLTNGRNVIGPVNTDLLLRGISQGRVPIDTYVAQSTWALWRPIDQIREVRALYKKPVTDEVGRPLAETFPFAGITDDDQLLKQALKLAVEQTHADVGVVHQDMAPHFGLVTSHAYGRGMNTALARVLPWWDPAREAAQQDKVLLSPSNKHDWSKAATMRLSNGGPVQAVALVPVKVAKGHRTLIELGSFRHSFRNEDAALLGKLSDAVSMRLEQLSF